LFTDENIVAYPECTSGGAATSTVTMSTTDFDIPDLVQAIEPSWKLEAPDLFEELGTRTILFLAPWIPGVNCSFFHNLLPVFT
jgi:hypothetical protein